MKKLVLLWLGILLLFVGVLFLQSMGDDARGKIAKVFVASLKSLLVREEHIAIPTFTDALHGSLACALTPQADGYRLQLEASDACTASFNRKADTTLRTLPAIKGHQGVCLISLQHHDNPHMTEAETHRLDSSAAQPLQLNLFENGGTLSIQAAGNCTIDFASDPIQP